MKSFGSTIVTVIASTALAGGFAWWARGHWTAAHGNREIPDSSRAAHASPTLYNCAMHPWIIRDKPGTCPICGMTLVPMKNHDHAEAFTSNPGAIRIDPTVVQNIGVKTEAVRRRELTKEVRLSGRLAADETRQVSVNAKIMGWVEKLHADYLGKSVRRGDVLLELYSPDLLTTQEEYLQALHYRQRLSPNAPADARRGAEDLVESARRRLEYWNIPASALERLEREGRARRTMPIVSPASGVLINKDVVEGQRIEAGMEMFRIADLSRVWAIGEAYQEDLPYLHPGQDAQVSLAYLPGHTFSGKVSFISPVLDPQSKTASLRVELQNNNARELKPEMVADIRIRFSLGSQIAVPQQAIIRSGKRNIAIVSLGQGYFEPREITLGATGGDYVQVLSGLKEGELLVVSSQFLIDSESNLKAAIQGMSSSQSGSNPE